MAGRGGSRRAHRGLEIEAAATRTLDPLIKSYAHRFR